MTRKSMSAALLATAAFCLATGAAFANNDRVPAAATGYVYPNFWASTSAEQQPRSAATLQGDGASVGIYNTHSVSTGTYLFPPNPNW